MHGYTPSSYGDGLADVYDEWYGEVSDVEATVRALAALAGAGPVLELGVGTGRLALPLAEVGLTVHGIDASSAMVERLRAKDPHGTVTVHLGDMVEALASDDLPRFTVVFVAYNTLFNLTSPGAQAAVFAAVADRLAPGGRFVVEAVVPRATASTGDHVGVRSLGVDHVVLSVSVHDADGQTVDGQFVEITETGGVRLRPWSIRWSTPAQLDAMAVAAGLELERRTSGFDVLAVGRDEPVDDRHVTVYRRPA